MINRSYPLLASLSLLLPACGAEVVSVPSPVTPSHVAPVAPSPVAGLGRCTTARPDGAVVALVAGADLMALDAGGRLRTLDAAPAVEPAAWVAALDVSPDGFVALSRQRRISSGETEITYALLGPDGAARWRRTQSVRHVGSPVTVSLGLHQLRVSAGGHVVANHQGFDRAAFSAAESLSPDGESRWLQGASGLGALDDTGRVLVESRPHSGESLRWWVPAAGTTEAVDASAVPGGASTVGPWALTWRVDPAGAVTLVSHRGARVERIALPFASMSDLRVVTMREEGWGLVVPREDDGVVHRIDLARARVEALRVRFPAGLRAVGGSDRVGVDATGALLAVLRDDSWARLYRSEDGARWTPVGRPVTGTFGVGALDRAGTFVVTAHNNLYGGEEWPDEPGAVEGGLRGPSLHVVRPATGREVVVYAAAPERSFGELEVALSPSGRCAAWVEPGDGSPTLEVADLEDGARHRVALPRVAGRLVWF